MAYSQERRAAVLVKMLPPSRMTIAALSRQEGISEKTLYKWRREVRAQGRLAPDAGEAPAGWTSRDKFAAVVETASLNVAETAAYCRERGLYPEQIAAWRAACEEESIPSALVAWLAQDIGVPATALADYTTRPVALQMTKAWDNWP
jgi:transposase-like protein